MILHNGILLLAAFNLAVNAALGLVILLHCPYSVWRIPAIRPDRGHEDPDINTTTKGETHHESGLD